MAPGEASGRSNLSLAMAVLPQLSDLAGDRWHVDGDDPPADASSAGRGADASGPVLPGDECLPDDFPDDEVVDGAEIGFVRPGSAAMFAQSVVFRDDDTAVRAWSQLTDLAFAECFVASVAEDARLLGPVEILGPVVEAASDFSTGERAALLGRSVAQRRAVLTGADGDSLVPVVIRLAVARWSNVVAVVWTVDGDTRGSERRWGHLVERVVIRGECAVG